MRWLFLFFIALPSHASVKDLSDDLSVAFFSQNNAYQLRLRPADSDIDSEVIFKPNTQPSFGYQLAYKWVVLFYSNSQVLEPEDKTKFGETSYEDLRGGLFMGKKQQYVLLGYYNRYKGMYIDNSQEIDSSIGNSDPRIQRPDLSIFNFGATFMYILDPDKFSAAAPFAQSAKQTSSGGSWLFTLSFDTSWVRDEEEDPIVPTQVASDFGEDATMTEGKFATLSASVGYGYSLIWWDDFYATATGLLGRGLQTRELTLPGETKKSDTTTTKWSWGFALGYNHESFFTSLAFVADALNFFSDSIYFEPSLSSIRFTLGVRF